MISWNRALRRRTRISTSPKRHGRGARRHRRAPPTASPRATMALISRAIRRGELAGGRSGGPSSTGRHGSTSAAARRRRPGPEVDAAAARPTGRRVRWRIACRAQGAGRRRPPGRRTPRRRSPGSRASSASFQQHGANCRPVPRPTKLLRLSRASRSGAAPWNEKIDCFSSPTAKTVRPRRRAPSPVKNSSVRARRIVPLVGRGVLRLVQQDVVDAAVELVEHPGGVGVRGQQRLGAARSGRRNPGRRARAFSPS